jgi:hypothetical protein
MSSHHAGRREKRRPRTDPTKSCEVVTPRSRRSRLSQPGASAPRAAPGSRREKECKAPEGRHQSRYVRRCRPSGLGDPPGLRQPGAALRSPPAALRSPFGAGRCRASRRSTEIRGVQLFSSAIRVRGSSQAVAQISAIMSPDFATSLCAPMGSSSRASFRGSPSGVGEEAGLERVVEAVECALLVGHGGCVGDPAETFTLHRHRCLSRASAAAQSRRGLCP